MSKANLFPLSKMSKVKSNPFRTSQEPSYEFKKDEWFIPLGNPYYVWFKESVELLQGARATYSKTGACPNCNSKTGITQSTRMINCSECNWKIDLEHIIVITPKLFIPILESKIQSKQRMLYQIKYEATFREVNLKDLFESIKDDEKILLKQMEDIVEHKKAEFLLTIKPKND